jgi:hypothetical protein
MNGKSEYVEKLFTDVARSHDKMKKHVVEMNQLMERTSTHMFRATARAAARVPVHWI